MLYIIKKRQFDRIYNIMEESFPIDEHRPYSEQKKLLEKPEYAIYGAGAETEEIRGFFAVWSLDELLFVEHFAVDAAYRDNGLGTQMLEELKILTGKRLCLEVEIPQNDLTKRRVDFYERNGFSLNEYAYMQPALSEGQKEVPLLIMTTDGKITFEEFERIRNLLYEKVYQVPVGKKADSIEQQSMVNAKRILQEEKDGCKLCPRECNVDRKGGKKGYCGVSGVGILGARAALHMWEEPCISGEEGSGTVFFSGCPLRCVYCQNYDIAHVERGTEITIERLSEIFLELQEKGANNINLVTPTHYSEEIIEAILRAKQNGLFLPIVYNCSGYEKVETLQLLDGIVDIYLTDFKYMDEDLAKRYSYAPDYPCVVKKALAEMVHQCGQAKFNEKGMMTKGVIVRHLLLPGQLENGMEVVRYVYETYGDSVFLSLMNQYTPLPHVKEYPELERKVTEEEYEALVDYAIEIGVENGFIQEGETAKESFIPAFDNEGWKST